MKITTLSSLVVLGIVLLPGGVFEVAGQPTLPAATFSLQADDSMGSSPGVISAQFAPGGPIASASVLNGPDLSVSVMPAPVNPLVVAIAGSASASETYDFEITGGTGPVTALLFADSTTTFGSSSYLSISDGGLVFQDGATNGGSFSDHNKSLSLEANTVYSVQLTVQTLSVGEATSADLDPPMLSLPDFELGNNFVLTLSPNFNPPVTVADSYSTLGILGSIMAGLFVIGRTKFLARRN